MPTFVEQGLPRFEFGSWQGFVAPAGTPDAVIATLNTAINKIFADPAVKKALEEQAFDVIGGKPDDFGTVIKSRRESHFDHNQENSFRQGGNAPPIWARSAGRDTVVLGLTWLPQYQRLLALPGAGIARPEDLKEKRLALPVRVHDKIDFWRASALQGYLQVLASVGLTAEDVTFVELPIHSTLLPRKEARPAVLYSTSSAVRAPPAQSFSRCFSVALAWVPEAFDMDRLLTNLWPSFSKELVEALVVRKDFLRDHGFLQHDFNVEAWLRPDLLEEASTDYQRRKALGEFA